MKRISLFCCAAIFSLLICPPSRADIFRLDNGELIPDTEGITPGPGVDLRNWNAADHNLRYADFSGGLDLEYSNFFASWLDNSRFNRANLTGANFEFATLTNTNLTAANLAGAYLACMVSISVRP